MEKPKHTCIIAIGMSGTGKTTFVNKMTQFFKNVVCINLDPAVKVLPYQPFIDIRKTHDYKKVMNQYKLGPNGAILTALNLYTAQPEIIVKEIEKKVHEATENTIFVVDIPGQIEVFTWSASSLILTESIALIMPVKIFYIVDAVRCLNPNTFLSNLLFAESIHFRLKKFQFILFLNKSDCADSDKLLQLMKDYDKFLDELNTQSSSYLTTLSKSVVIHLSDLFQKIEVCKISAKTGYGFQEIQKYLNGMIMEQ